MGLCVRDPPDAPIARLVIVALAANDLPALWTRRSAWSSEVMSDRRLRVGQGRQELQRPWRRE